MRSWGEWFVYAVVVPAVVFTAWALLRSFFPAKRATIKQMYEDLNVGKQVDDQEIEAQVDSHIDETERRLSDDRRRQVRAAVVIGVLVLLVYLLF